jgi:hypothetical protein
VKKRKLTLSEIALIASTRGMLGAGIGLLLSSKLNKDQRRAAGWTLVAVGAITTIPLAMNIFGKNKKGQRSETVLRVA